MRLFCLGCVLLAAGLLSGCGGKASPAPAPAPSAAAPASTPAKTSTPSPEPALTSASDLAACAQLEQAVRAVSALVGHTTEGITQALHTDELAAKTETARQSLVDSARLIALVKDMPEPLVGPQLQLEQALRRFAADFARAKASTAKGDVNKAAAQTVDETALRQMQKSVKKIDDLCGA